MHSSFSASYSLTILMKINLKVNLIKFTYTLLIGSTIYVQHYSAQMVQENMTRNATAVLIILHCLLMDCKWINFLLSIISTYGPFRNDATKKSHILDPLSLRHCWSLFSLYPSPYVIRQIVKVFFLDQRP